MTRLRFNLKDTSKVDLEPVKNIAGVSGAVNKGGQIQVMIGTYVLKVYDAILPEEGCVYSPVTGNMGTK